MTRPATSIAGSVAVALELLADLGAGRLRFRQPPTGKAQPLGRDELDDFLERISRWDNAAWFAHRERYLGTYGPLPFLPPDCLNAVVLQATLGHADGRSFGMGRAAEYYVRTPAEFEQHAREVAALWGRRLSQSRVAFLAGSDVLRCPVDDVAAYLDAIRRALPISSKAPRAKRISPRWIRTAPATRGDPRLPRRLHAPSTRSNRLERVRRAGTGPAESRRRVG